MTYCEKRGWKVGDKFIVRNTLYHYLFKRGDIVELLRDDGSEAAKFMNKEGVIDWVHIDDVKKVEYNGTDLLEKLHYAVAKRDKQRYKAEKATANLSKCEAEVERLTALLSGTLRNVDESDIPDGVDVDDPKTWRIGDVIECVYSASSYVTEGFKYVFDGFDEAGDVRLLQDDDDDNFAPAKAEVAYRFHHRPKS